MELTKEQEEKMVEVIGEVKEDLLRQLIDNDDAMQGMIEKIFGEVKDDDEWALCCGLIITKIFEGK